MTNAEFRLHVAQQMQWTIHEQRWQEADAIAKANGTKPMQPRPPFDVVKLWEMVAPDTRAFYETMAEVAVGLCEGRGG